MGAVGGWEGSTGSGAAYVNRGGVEGIGFEDPWLIVEREGCKVAPWIHTKCHHLPENRERSAMEPCL